MKKVNIKFFFLLILFWVILSFFNVFYNSVKTVFELREWGYLSDSEKRHKLFGDLYPFLIFIQGHTEKDATVLIYSSDTMTYYLARYILYPRKIYAAKDRKEVQKLVHEKHVTYIVIYNLPLQSKDYKLIHHYLSKTSKDFSGIYKKK